MRTGLVLPATVAGALAACIALFRWGVAVTDDLAYYAGQERLCERLDERVTATQGKSEGRRRVAAELIAGRLSLAEAAERFGRLDAAAKARGAVHRAMPEEPRCLDVLHYTRGALVDHEPERAATILARLESEFRERFHHAPKLPPEVPPGRGPAVP